MSTVLDRRIGGAMTVVPVLNGASFAVGAPRARFSVDGYARQANRQQYDVAPGDDRFLMIKMPPAPPVPPGGDGGALVYGVAGEAQAVRAGAARRRDADGRYLSGVP